jgi:hypothetical protein
MIDLPSKTCITLTCPEVTSVIALAMEGLQRNSKAFDLLESLGHTSQNWGSRWERDSRAEPTRAARMSRRIGMIEPRNTTCALTVAVSVDRELRAKMGIPLLRAQLAKFCAVLS